MNPAVTWDGHTITVWEAGAPILELTPGQAAQLARHLDAAAGLVA